MGQTLWNHKPNAKVIGVCFVILVILFLGSYATMDHKAKKKSEKKEENAVEVPGYAKDWKAYEDKVKKPHAYSKVTKEHTWMKGVMTIGKKKLSFPMTILDLTNEGFTLSDDYESNDMSNIPPGHSRFYYMTDGTYAGFFLFDNFEENPKTFDQCMISGCKFSSVDNDKPISLCGVKLDSEFRGNRDKFGDVYEFKETKITSYYDYRTRDGMNLRVSCNSGNGFYISEYEFRIDKDAVQ